MRGRESICVEGVWYDVAFYYTSSEYPCNVEIAQVRDDLTGNLQAVDEELECTLVRGVELLLGVL